MSIPTQNSEEHDFTIKIHKIPKEILFMTWTKFNGKKTTTEE